MFFSRGGFSNNFRKIQSIFFQLSTKLISQGFRKILRLVFEIFSKIFKEAGKNYNFGHFFNRF